jgi:hypothetical protein
MSIYNKIKQLKTGIVLIGYTYQYLYRFLYGLKPYEYYELQSVDDLDNIKNTMQNSKTFVLLMDTIVFNTTDNDTTSCLHRANGFNKLYRNQLSILSQNNLVITCHHIYQGLNMSYAPTHSAEMVLKLDSGRYEGEIKVSVLKDRHGDQKEYYIQSKYEFRKLKLKRILKYEN